MGQKHVCLFLSVVGVQNRGSVRTPSNYRFVEFIVNSGRVLL